MRKTIVYQIFDPNKKEFIVRNNNSDIFGNVYQDRIEKIIELYDKENATYFINQIFEDKNFYVLGIFEAPNYKNKDQAEINKIKEIETNRLLAKGWIENPMLDWHPHGDYDGPITRIENHRNFFTLLQEKEDKAKAISEQKIADIESKMTSYNKQLANIENILSEKSKHLQHINERISKAEERDRYLEEMYKKKKDIEEFIANNEKYERLLEDERKKYESLIEEAKDDYYDKMTVIRNKINKGNEELETIQQKADKINEEYKDKQTKIEELDNRIVEYRIKAKEISYLASEKNRFKATVKEYRDNNEDHVPYFEIVFVNKILSFETIKAILNEFGYEYNYKYNY